MLSPGPKMFRDAPRRIFKMATDIFIESLMVFEPGLAWGVNALTKRLLAAYDSECGHQVIIRSKQDQRPATSVHQ